jgi:imidazoleglycerol-phosphate dehydratase
MAGQRTAEISRKTKETDIQIKLDLDGTGKTEIDTGVPFFDHMLDAFGRHGLFDLSVHCKGDIEVDAHHSVEDCGIVLGQAIAQSLGDKRGITRYASIALPMDETLVLAAIDISGRGACYANLNIPAEQVGNFDTELGLEFFIALATNAGITLHIQQLAGVNSHHILEASFKAVARALSAAVAIDSRIEGVLPSTKGAL